MTRQRWSMVSGSPFVYAALLLLLFTGIFFAPLLQGRSFTMVAYHQRVIFPWAAYAKAPALGFPQTDQADLSYPWHVLLTRALAEGTFPFWNPYSYAGGQPLYANGSSALLYPPRLLLAALVPPDWAHDLFSCLHVFLAGLFTLALLREYGAGLASSLLAAISWMFAGFVLAWLHLEVVVPSFMFLPLLVFCVARLYRTRTWRMTVVTALAMALLLMSGHLIFAGLTYLCAISYAAALGLGEVWRSRRGARFRVAAREIGRLSLIVGLSLLAASVVLIPTALTLTDSQRAPFTYAGLKANFLASWSVFQYSFYPPSLPLSAPKMHKMAFVGTLTAILALIGALTRRRGAWFGLSTYIIVALVATGTPLTWFVFHFVPGFDVFRPYSRLLMFSSFATAVLGGLGLDAVVQTWQRSWRKRFAARSLWSRFEFAAGIVALILALTALQLMRYGREINPPFARREPANFYPSVPFIDALREQSPPHHWPARVLPIITKDVQQGWTRPMFFAAQPLVHAIDSAIGYDSVMPRRAAVMVRILTGQNAKTVAATGLPSAYVPMFYPSQTRYDLAERMGITLFVTPPDFDDGQWQNLESMVPVTQVYAAKDGKIYHINGSRVGPRLLYDVEIVDTSDAALFRFIDPAFPFKSNVLLESAEVERAGLTAAAAGTGPGEILAATRTMNDATVRVHSETPAWLVLAETWAPGWTATVNDKSTEVLRGNYAQRVVRVPAGESIVRLTYRPPGWTAGLSLSAASWLVGLVCLGWLTRARWRGSSRQSSIMPCGHAMRGKPAS